MSKKTSYETYFTTKKPQKNISNLYSNRSIKDFDIEKESLKLYTFPFMKNHLNSDTTLQKAQCLQDKGHLLMDQKRVNIFKDQSTPLFIPINITNKNNNHNSFAPLSQFNSNYEEKLFPYALSFEDLNNNEMNHNYSSSPYLRNKETNQKYDHLSKGKSFFNNDKNNNIEPLSLEIHKHNKGKKGIMTSSINMKESYRDNFKNLSNFLASKKEKPQYNNKNTISTDTMRKEDRTLYTISGNCTFRENLKSINRKENLWTEGEKESYVNEQSKKIPLKKKGLAFLTQRSQDEGEELFKECTELSVIRPEEDFRAFLQKFGFHYFAIGIKGKESPLKMTICTGNSDNRLTRLKLYLSSKNKTPNKFNSEFEYEVMA